MPIFARLQKLVASIRTNEASYKSINALPVRNGRYGPSRAAEVGRSSIDPFAYTSGRWLKDDKRQREARYIGFDFQALCALAIKACPGAQKIIKYEKREGAFNRVFVLHMDNGPRIVARIPFCIAGPRMLATHSEVATMAYLRQHSHIPVPKVLDWSDDQRNPIGTEYIIMEHVPGVQLHGRCNSMSMHQHMLCVKELARVVKGMVNIKFPAYGSLYFADAPIEPASKMDFVEGFCVGPHCGAPVWPSSPVEVCSYDQSMSHRGPWSDLQGYCAGLIEAGFARLPNGNTPGPKLDFRGSVEEHRRLLETCCEVIKALITSPVIRSISDPTLLHPDLNKRNIYVSDDDPTKILALIDWQSSGIDPIFAYANEMPDLLTAPLNMPALLEGGGTATGEEDPEVKKLRKDISICQQTFEVAMKGWAPKFHEARVVDEVFLRVIRYCATSWRDGAAALRGELIEVSQCWHELGLAGSCPYQPTDEELQRHKKQYEDFEAFQKLKLFLVQTTNSNSDGWVPSEAWTAAEEAQKMAFEDWIKTVRENGDPEMTEEKAKSLWPFDID